MQNDSTDKIIERYFSTVAREAFTYRGKRFVPKQLKVSPLLLRDYSCPSGCGGCCFKFTLDYLPTDPMPKEGLIKRFVEFSDRQVPIYTDFQHENETNRCRYLMKDGRCGNYPTRPFTCDFELIRTLQAEQEDSPRPNVLTQKLFGRGWSYQRTDGGKGALCEMKPVSPKSVAEVIRKLKRLQQWTDHFRLKTWTPDLISLIERGHLDRAIVFDPKQNAGFGL